MKTMIPILPAIALLSLISCTLVNAKCKNITEDDGCTVYSCAMATLDDISEIPDEAERIRFTISQLANLPERAFARFSNLHRLSFYNSELGPIDPKAFDGLEKLQQLTFYGSNIHVLRVSWFKDMSNLTHLFLDQNDMIYIEPNVFASTPSLGYLNIEDNNLNCLTKEALMPLKKLRHARIEGNPWLCNCYSDIVEWMNNRGIDSGPKNSTKTRLECMMDLGTQSTDSENSYFPISEHVSITRSGNVLCIGGNISALSLVPDNVKSMKFLNTDLPEIPKLAFFRFGNSLRTLDLDNCSISSIHPEAFAGLSKLEKLILSNNSISTVKSDWFRDLRGLKHLVMDSNGIEHIEFSVFPLLDKLRTLSLRKNDIGCFPMRAFASMRHLNDMSIANNTWICSCLQDFRKWFLLNATEYAVLPTQCTDNKTHMIGRQYIPGYRNASFQRELENEETKIIKDNARLLLDGTLSDVNPFGDDPPGIIAPFENDNVKVTDEEARHKRNKEIANYEYHRLRVQEVKQGYVFDIRAKYDGFEKTAAPEVPSNYTNCLISPDELAEDKKVHRFTEAPKFRQIIPDEKKSYASIGGVIWEVMTISFDAESIRFERAKIPKIIAELFVRHVNLQVLTFSNCGVREIEPQAFKGLMNLRELFLDDNEIVVVKAAWFEDTPNLERLSLVRNSITRIENGVFQLLPNLKSLRIASNQLNCIGIEGLSNLKELRSIDVANNPWSCLCQIKLNQWLIEHDVRFDGEIFDGSAAWDCIEEYQDPKTTKGNKYQNKNSIDNGKSNVDCKAEVSTVIQEAINSLDIDKIREIRDADDSENTKPTGRGVQQTVPTPTTTAGPEHEAEQCRFHQFNRMKESRWWCNGGDISVLDKIPSSAERIDLINSNLTVLPANAFVRFSNLTRLFFYNSSIYHVEPTAFATLNKLDWLMFVNNSIPTIRSSWFKDLANITALRLVRNSISEIEADVFEKLPNLERLSIQENNLRCIYTESLSSLKNLQRVGLQSNPWKWRCQEELIQFLEARNISYQISVNDKGRRVLGQLPLDNHFE